MRFCCRVPVIILEIGFGEFPPNIQKSVEQCSLRSYVPCSSDHSPVKCAKEHEKQAAAERAAVTLFWRKDRLPLL